MERSPLNTAPRHELVYPLDLSTVWQPGHLHVIDRDLNIVALPARDDRVREPRVLVRTGMRREAGCVYTLEHGGMHRLRPRGA